MDSKDKIIIDKYNTGVKILAQKTITIYTISFREDGILHGHVSKGGKWKASDYEILFPLIGEMVGYKKVPLLATYEKDVFPTAESSAYWADPATTCPYFSSEALIMDSLPLKILGNFYVEYKKPQRPTKIFDDHEKAVQWLKTFL